MIHPVVVNPVLNPVVRVTDPVRWRAGRMYPSDSILHWDADVAAFTEQVGGPHTFNHAVLSPQFQLNADGSYVNAGAKPAVDVFGGKRWLRSCGAITNLFNGDTSQARSVSLTNGTVYTLHVFGAGTVSCSYGTATVAEPLKITATATESVEFTPDGATYWMLTATAYPVPYVPPGVTQPASNATTTGGSWFANPDGSELWKALDGQADGVELNNFAPIDVSTTVAWTPLRTRNDISLTHRHAILLQVDEISGGSIHVYCQNSLQVATINSPGIYTIRSTPSGTHSSFSITPNRTGMTVKISFISIQRIQPQPLTIATRVRMGVGSGDLPNSSNLSIASCLGADSISTARIDSVGNAVVHRAYDGSTDINRAGAWPRNAIINRVTQVNTEGTQFRVGYMIEGTHTTIQWGSWTNYDSSFNPSTLYRLMLGYNNAYPMWFSRITAWKEQVSDERILEALNG